MPVFTLRSNPDSISWVANCDLPVVAGVIPVALQRCVSNLCRRFVAMLGELALEIVMSVQVNISLNWSRPIVHRATLTLLPS